MASPASGSKQGPLFAPLILRVALGVTFIWAGLGKLVPLVEFKGQDAAILANLGTGIAPTHAVKPGGAGSPVDAAPGGPTLAPPPTLPLPDAPTTTPAGGSKPTNSKAKPNSRQNRQPAEIGSASHGTPSVLAALATDDLPEAANAVRTKSKAGGAGRIQPPSPPAGAANVPVQTPSTEALPPGGKFTAADFPEPARARRAYQVSVLMVHAAYPQVVPGQPTPKGYWPRMLADSPWVVWLSFGTAVVELFAGVLLIVGFLTRLSSGMLVLVMLNALWLTQIGPAMSTGQTQFGFLPDKTWWDSQLWSTFLWQVLIIASAIAVACMGGGALSVDRALAVIGSGGPKSEPDPQPKG